MRAYPPASVWLLVGWLTGLPVGLMTVADAAGFVGVAVAFGFGLAAAPLVLAGQPFGFALALTQAVVTGAVAVALVAVTTGLAVTAAGGTMAVGLSLALATWPVLLAVLVWWPETRRWCGLLATADGEGDG